MFYSVLNIFNFGQFAQNIHVLRKKGIESLEQNQIFKPKYL